MFTPTASGLQNIDVYPPGLPYNQDYPPGNNDNGEKQLRKRMRVPTSCSVCRKRKIKCDKVKPVCSGCSKSNVPHLCHYEEPSWVNSDEITKHTRPSTSNSSASGTTSAVTNVSPNNTTFDPQNLPSEAKKIFDELTSRVKHLEASIAVHDLSKANTKSAGRGDRAPSPIRNTNPNQYDQRSEAPFYDNDPSETVNLFDYLPFVLKKNRIECFGPFSIVSSMRKDAYLKVLWILLWKTIDNSVGVIDPSRDDPENINQKSTCISELVKDDPKGAQELGRFLELRKKKTHEKQYVARLFAEKDKSLDDLILSVLPNKKITMLLCFRFFKYVYPYFPFIEENAFFSEVDSLIGPLGFNDSEIPAIKKGSRYDYASIALLLIVLRMAFITITPKEFQENEDLKSLLHSPIEARVIHIAMKCIDHYKVLKKPYNLKVFQAMFLHKIYYSYCYEDDETPLSADSQIGLGTLFSVAYSLGLNRNPDAFPSNPGSTKNKSQAQIWRKIWHRLLAMDATLATTSTGRINVRDDHDYDCPLPIEDPHDDPVDFFVNRDYEFLDKKTKLLREVARVCNNVNTEPRIIELQRLVRKIEGFIATHLGSIEDIVNDPSLPNYGIVKRVSYFIELETLVISIDVNILRHFCIYKNTRHAYDYVEKCLRNVVKLCNTLMNIAYNEDLYFKPGYAFFLRPVTNFATVRACLFYLASLGRVLQVQQSIADSHDRQRIKIFHDFGELLFTRMENVLQLLSKISSNYYNFSRVFMAMKLFYLIMRSPKFNFVQLIDDLLDELENPQSKTQLHYLHDLKREEIPKSDLMSEYLDPEIIHLMSRTQTNVLNVLQPYFRNYTRTRRPAHQPTAPPQPSAPSPFVMPLDTPTPSSGSSYYDPISGKTVVNSDAAPTTGTTGNNVSPLSSSDINVDDIFGSPQKFPSFNSSLSSSDDSNSVTSEEYASFFGIFEDYNGFHGG